MIVAITSSTAGVQPLEQFSEAVDVATAIAEFAAIPPTNPADWRGLDTGYTPGAIPSPASGFRFAWDGITPALTQIPIVDNGWSKFTSGTTLQQGFSTVDTTAAPVKMLLPTAVEGFGKTYQVRLEKGGNILQVGAQPGDTVDGAADVQVTALTTTFVSDGRNAWQTF